MNSLIEIRNVSKVFGGGFLRGSGNTALDNVSLKIDTDKPSVIAIAGESGSGKTTLAQLLLGFIEPTRGAVLYKGESIANLSRNEMKQYRRDVQAIFQDPFEVFNPFYRVDHVLSVAVSKYGLANSKDEARHVMESALLSVGLRPEETLGRYPHQLSGGQRQRIMVARVVMLNPRVIVADEPVSMIDASLRTSILSLLMEIHNRKNTSFVYITHDLTTAHQIADQIIILYQGLVVEAGSIEKVIKDPQHPYTRLLISSIPSVDPRKPWRSQSVITNTLDSGDGTYTGCVYASRCPIVTPECHVRPPALYRTDSDRAVACYYFKAAPIASPVDDIAGITTGNLDD